MRLPADPAEEAMALRLRRIREEIGECAVKSGRSPDAIRLLAVTKTVPPERVNFVLDNGVEWIGENRVQEYLDKRSAYHIDEKQVHFIGHLQTNKVKYIIDKVSMIQSVSSLKLAEEIDRRAAAAGREMEILLEVNMAGEATKGGFAPRETLEAARYAARLEGVRLRGIMCIPPIAALPGENREIFKKTFQLFVDIRRKIVDNNVDITCLSMGMSRDYQDAVREGATIVRVGTGLFGPRS